VTQLLYVSVGGALGTAARYLVTLLVARTGFADVPLATLAVNVAGSFLLGLLVMLADRGLVGPDLRLALTTGVMGGFTTYSTFNYETLLHWQRGAWTLAVANVIGTVVLCLVAGALGLALGRSWTT
jgi:fluoride exporter